MDLEQTAIARLRTAAHMSEKVYHKPLLVTTSGGKDSSVCAALAERAGIEFEVMHNHTTADAPETVYFIRNELRRLEAKGIKCMISYPTYKGIPTTMWKLIPMKLMPPTRLVRYCCAVFKEQGGKDRFITTGVRWAESNSRKNNRGIYESVPSDAKKKIILNNDNDDTRQLFESCSLKAKRACNPIVDWTDADVWSYIRAESIPVNPLYSCGFSRVGCVGCPMASKARWREFARYPKYRLMYVRAFDEMIAERTRRGLSRAWKTGEDVFHWWMEDGVLPEQIGMDEWMRESAMLDNAAAHEPEKIAETPPPIMAAEPAKEEDAA